MSGRLRVTVLLVAGVATATGIWVGSWVWSAVS